MEIESLPKVQHCSTKYFGQVVGIFLLESLSWVSLVNIEKVKTDFWGCHKENNTALISGFKKIHVFLINIVSWNSVFMILRGICISKDM